MKKIAVALTALALVFFMQTTSAQGILNKIKDKTKQRADQKVDQAIDKGLDKTEEGAKKKPDEPESKQPDKNSQESTTKPAPGIKSYQNYDFVPGDKILFEDNFIGDQDGEFPTHWELSAGQAVLNKINSELALHLTDGNYARVTPRMKTQKYLADPFTLEYDYYHAPGAYGVVLLLNGFDKKEGFDRESNVYVNNAEAGFLGTASGVSFSKSFPEELTDNFSNKWHHVAVAFKNHQIKVYVDQYRILVVPDSKEDYDKVTFAGIGNDKAPIIFKNVRIAAGGDMNMIGKKFTESKIVTHGINFDIDKATIKPESMGTLNMIVQVMKENPDVKFEVDGHTDNSGTAQHNLVLSQQRADAVKDQLTKMGIDASRLTSKGLGDTKPVGDNNTLDGKANNRRVEFVKI